MNAFFHLAEGKVPFPIALLMAGLVFSSAILNLTRKLTPEKRR